MANGAGDETRTRDIHVGNVMLYQLSYSRMVLREGLEPSRPYEQRILSPLCLPIPPPERDVLSLSFQRTHPLRDVYIIPHARVVYTTFAAICPGGSS